MVLGDGDDGPLASRYAASRSWNTDDPGIDVQAVVGSRDFRRRRPWPLPSVTMTSPPTARAATCSASTLRPISGQPWIVLTVSEIVGPIDDGCAMSRAYAIGQTPARRRHMEGAAWMRRPRHPRLFGSVADGGPIDSPSGLRWRLTGSFTTRSRRTRFERFMAEMQPAPTDRILDVGVTNSAWRSSNFLEAMYPYSDQITAVGLVDMPTFRTQFPRVPFVEADGRRLPFVTIHSTSAFRTP